MISIFYICLIIYLIIEGDIFYIKQWRDTPRRTRNRPVHICGITEYFSHESVQTAKQIPFLLSALNFFYVFLFHSRWKKTRPQRGKNIINWYQLKVWKEALDLPQWPIWLGPSLGGEHSLVGGGTLGLSRNWFFMVLMMGSSALQDLQKYESVCSYFWVSTSRKASGCQKSRYVKIPTCKRTLPLPQLALAHCSVDSDMAIENCKRRKHRVAMATARQWQPYFSAVTVSDLRIRYGMVLHPCRQEPSWYIKSYSKARGEICENGCAQGNDQKMTRNHCKKNGCSTVFWCVSKCVWVSIPMWPVDLQHPLRIQKVLQNLTSAK